MMSQFDVDVHLAERVDLNVLIAGERHAGAADVARFLHDRSGRRNAPFVTIACAAMGDTELEVELRAIGRASGGSLLLEDVDALSSVGQKRMATFVQDAEVAKSGDTRRGVDVRVMATTTQPLFERMTAGAYLPELYYCLNAIYIRTYPLREVRDDLPSLVERMLQDIGTSRHVTPPHIGGAAMSTLQAYDWPGNLRELHDVLEALLISPRRGEIEPDDLNAAIDKIAVQLRA